jgi:BolA family transcriptional regulator, general stress-responsive regulator
MRTADEIHARLTEAFTPVMLSVADESEQHRGHAGWRDGGETHFRVTMQAPALAPMSRIARHRAVHAALGPDLVGRIHALTLDLTG